MDVRLVGVPLQEGASCLGCEMGPSALRVAGLADAMRDLGHTVRDVGNVAPSPSRWKAATEPNERHEQGKINRCKLEKISGFT